MKLELVRNILTDQSTIGDLSVDGQYECHVLENPLRLNPALGPEHIAIPYGTYDVAIRRDSPRFHMDVPILLGVPNRTAIEIHPGNATKDTHGCLLPGKTKATNFVGNSREAFNELFQKIKGALNVGNRVTIEIKPVSSDVELPAEKKGD